MLVTAGASAPEDVVEECLDYLRDRFGATVEPRTIREETRLFPAAARTTQPRARQ